MGSVKKLRQYGILLEYVKSHPVNTKDQILDRLSDHQMGVSERTFERLKIELRDDLGIELKYENESYKIKELENPHRATLMRFIQIANEWDFYEQALHNKAHFDKINFEAENLSFYSLLPDIFKAIIENKVISFDYEFFEEDVTRRIETKPLLLKEYQNRWYVLGYTDFVQDSRNYGLDRIENLEIHEAAFNPKDYGQFTKNYDAAVGLNTSGEMIDLIIQADEIQAKYLRKVPLHSSQDEFKPAYFSYQVIWNFELEQRLMMLGERIEILEPKALKEWIISRLQKALNTYK